VLKAVFAFPVLSLAGCSSPAVRANQLPLTLACDDGDDNPTQAQTEGPFFTPNSPERVSLIESGLRGARLQLTGRVLTVGCVPVAGALLDFWHADDAGEYDLRGYRLRGHQFTDAQGSFSLETIVPGLYPGRTRHVHVKVQARNGPVLTTQLYFPGEAANRRDGIYSDELLMRVNGGADGQQGRFNFVVRT
jgi:protocatechuate 3,4-dioxygenase beta subunit